MIIAEAGVGMPNMTGMDPSMMALQDAAMNAQFNDIMANNFAPDAFGMPSAELPGGMDPGMLDALMAQNFAFDTLAYDGSNGAVAELDDDEINALVAPSLAFEAMNAEAITAQVAAKNTHVTLDAHIMDHQIREMVKDNTSNDTVAEATSSDTSSREEDSEQDSNDGRTKRRSKRTRKLGKYALAA